MEQAVDVDVEEDAWQASVLQILVEEYGAAMQDAGLPATTQVATLKFFGRYEARAGSLANLPEVPACRKGCAHCCHQRVSAPAQEVFLLAEAITTLPAARRERVLERLRANARAVRGMDAAQHQRTPLRCALLDEAGACMAYDARPSSCRRYHSMDGEDCKSAFADVGNPGRRIRLSPPHLAMNMAQYLGFRKGLIERGLDTAQYELSTALVEALDDALACRERFAAGARAFTQAVVTSAAADLSRRRPLD